MSKYGKKGLGSMPYGNASGAKAPPPSTGHMKRVIQGSSTSPRTDGGGGIGNDAHKNHKKLIGC